MLKLLLIVLSLIPLTTLAANFPRHMVMLNQWGFGGYASYEHFSPRSDSIFDKYDILTGNIELNYTYALDSRWQMGGFFINNSQGREVKTATGKTGQIKTDNRIVGTHLLYNFSDDLYNSWLTGAVLSYHNQEEEFAKGIQDFLEDDRQAVYFEALIGKRFSLKNNGLANITYSPSLSFFVANSKKDYEDDKINFSYGVNIHFLKFDVLF
jgi:hypothetical protein